MNEWLCASKLSLNIAKSNFVIFHPPQKVLPFTVKLILKDQSIKVYMKGKMKNFKFRNLERNGLP